VIYYVDNSSPFASDSNLGTSVDRPFLSLAAINGKTFKPGDVIAFRAGTSYTETFDYGGALRVTSSGTAEAPITFTSYGEGEKPVISNLSGKYSDAVKVLNASYVVFDDLKFGAAQQAGLHINKTSSHVTVTNTEATNVGEGFLVEGQYNKLTHNYIHDLHMVKNTDGGAKGSQQMPGEPTATAWDDDDYGANGFVISGSHNEFAYNKVVNAKAASHDYDFDGGAFELWGVVDDTKIHHNWTENSVVFMESGGLPGALSNLEISNNVSLNNGQFVTLHNNGGAYGGTLSNVVAHHNTIVEEKNGPHKSASVFLDGPASSDQFKFHHNVVSLNDGDSVFKSHGDYHSDNVFELRSAATHIYNDWSMALAPGEVVTKAPFESPAARDFDLLATGPRHDVGALLTSSDTGLTATELPPNTPQQPTAPTSPEPAPPISQLPDAPDVPVSQPISEVKPEPSPTGAPTNDTLKGTVGADTMYGGPGNDTFIVNHPGDVLVEYTGEGIDVVNTTVSFSLSGGNVERLMLLGTGAINGTGNDLANEINGNDAENVISGGTGDDMIRGAGGDDSLFGNDANDTLNGHSGRDVLNGGAGTDIMIGGTDADTFVFSALSDFGPITAMDRIADLSRAQGDKIHLAGIDANTGMAGDQAFTFLGQGEFTKHAGDLRSVSSAGGQQTVSGDVNGDGVADFHFLVQGGSLTPTDFNL
jgi:Ca2+-binding RTX toxin-like protein